MDISHYIYKFHHEPHWKNKSTRRNIMSEKFNGISRRVQHWINSKLDIIPNDLLRIVSSIIINMLIYLAVIGTIFWVVWNTILAELFYANKMTLFQAWISTVVIASLELDHLSIAKFIYKKLSKAKMANGVAVVLAIVFELVLILIASFGYMWLWNIIIPQSILKWIPNRFKYSLATYCFFNVIFNAKRYGSIDII